MEGCLQRRAWMVFMAASRGKPRAHSTASVIMGAAMHARCTMDEDSVLGIVQSFRNEVNPAL